MPLHCSCNSAGCSGGCALDVCSGDSEVSHASVPTPWKPRDACTAPHCPAEVHILALLEYIRLQHAKAVCDKRGATTVDFSCVLPCDHVAQSVLVNMLRACMQRAQLRAVALWLHSKRGWRPCPHRPPGGICARCCTEMRLSCSTTDAPVALCSTGPCGQPAHPAPCADSRVPPWCSKRPPARPCTPPSDAPDCPCPPCSPPPCQPPVSDACCPCRPPRCLRSTFNWGTLPQITLTPPIPTALTLQLPRPQPFAVQAFPATRPPVSWEALADC